MNRANRPPGIQTMLGCGDAPYWSIEAIMLAMGNLSNRVEQESTEETEIFKSPLALFALCYIESLVPRHPALVIRN